MKFISTFITLIIVLIASIANASTLNFNGTINKIFSYDGCRISYHDTSNYFGNSFTLGDQFNGIADYEYTSEPIAQSKHHAVYNHDTLSGIKVSFKDYVFNSYGKTNDYGFVQVQNDFNHSSSTDGFQVSDKYYQDGLYHDAELYLFDDSASVFDDLILPSLIVGDAFNTRIFHQSFINLYGEQLHVYGTIDNFDPIDSAPVPEPSSFLLFGIGILFFTGIARKKPSVKL